MKKIVILLLALTVTLTSLPLFADDTPDDSGCRCGVDEDGECAPCP